MRQSPRKNTQTCGRLAPVACEHLERSDIIFWKSKKLRKHASFLLLRLAVVVIGVAVAIIPIGVAVGVVVSNKISSSSSSSSSSS